VFLRADVFRDLEHYAGLGALLPSGKEAIYTVFGVTNKLYAAGMSEYGLIPCQGKKCCSPLSPNRRLFPLVKAV
jgi:hypothetical protein